MGEGYFRKCRIVTRFLQMFMIRATQSSSLDSAGARLQRGVSVALPEHRQIPSVATLSNTVQLRLDGNNHYAPENVKIVDRRLSGYSIAQVLPYKDVQKRIRWLGVGGIKQRPIYRWYGISVSTRTPPFRGAYFEDTIL